MTENLRDFCFRASFESERGYLFDKTRLQLLIPTGKLPLVQVCASERARPGLGVGGRYVLRNKYVGTFRVDERRGEMKYSRSFALF